jgi:hypothetical protein
VERTTTTYGVRSGQLPDGNFQVAIIGVRPATRSIEVDLVQVLHGEAALRAYAVENPDDPSGPPNDYYVINNDPSVWRVPVAREAKLTVLRYENDSFEPREGTLADLDDDEQWFCDIVVRGGSIIELTEGYRP